MKKALLIAAIATMSALGTINAQEVTMTNDALSKQYAQQIKV